MGMQVVSLAEVEIAEEAIGAVTPEMAELYRVIPVNLEGSQLTLATCDPQNLSIQDELRTFLGL